MTIDYREFFPDDLSDEAAYHLINFFYHLALLFEDMHLGQALRHEKFIIKSGKNSDPNLEETLPDPPF